MTALDQDVGDQADVVEAAQGLGEHLGGDRADPLAQTLRDERTQALNGLRLSANKYACCT